MTNGMPAPSELAPITWRQLAVAPVVGIALGSAVVVVLVIAWMVAGSGGRGAADFGNAAAQIGSNFYFNIGTVAALYLPLIAVLFLYARKLTPPPAVRFFPAIKPLTLFLALASGVVAAFCCMGIEELLSRLFGVTFELTQAEKSFYPATGVQFLAAAVVMGFVGPLAEEIYFRGFLLQWLRQRLSLGWAMAISAAAFALMHVFMLLHPGASGWVTTGEIFVVGIIMALWVSRTGSLWSSYAMHIGYNCVVVMQTFLFPN